MVVMAITWLHWYMAEVVGGDCETSPTPHFWHCFLSSDFLVITMVVKGDNLPSHWWHNRMAMLAIKRTPIALCFWPSLWPLYVSVGVGCGSCRIKPTKEGEKYCRAAADAVALCCVCTHHHPRSDPFPRPWQSSWAVGSNLDFSNQEFLAYLEMVEMETKN